MAREHYAKVIGHMLLEGDIGDEGILVVMRTASKIKGTAISRRAVFPIESRDKDKYPIGRVMLISMELHQGELPFSDEKAEKPAKAQRLPQGSLAAV